MLSLKGKHDSFRLLLPEKFLVPEIDEKYAEVLAEKKSFYQKPIDFLNETIQSVEVLGFVDGTVVQPQPGRGTYAESQDRREQNKFMHTTTDYAYRSEVNPLQLIDKTLNINFRHTVGFINYFMMFENFFWMFARDTQYKDLVESFTIDIMNERGAIYSRIVMMDPIVNSMDMLSLDYTRPIAESGTFKVEFKYSNIDFQFIKNDDLLDLNENVIVYD